MAGIKLLEVLKVDDVVGAIPTHLFCSIWGSLAACLASGADFMVQLSGVLAIGMFVFPISLILWTLIDKAVGARVSPRVEEIGQDSAELGIESYPEFRLMPDMDGIDDGA